MTGRRVRNSLAAVLAFTVAATLIVGSAFAADSGNGKFKRRGNSGKVTKFLPLKTDRGTGGNIISIPPKANRTGGLTTAPLIVTKGDRSKVGPIQVFSANRTGGLTTAPLIVTKGDRSKVGPVQVFSLPSKAPRADGGSTTTQVVAPKAPRGDGPTAVKFVATKAPRGDGQVVAKVDEPKVASPQLSAPVNTAASTKVEQPTSAPAPVEAKAPALAVTEASAREVELAYIRAAQRYGYGDYGGRYESYDQGYDDGYTGSSYGDDGCY